jgi:predicted DsbA family dithiol-disulfide isomerase
MKIEIWSDIACPWCFIGKRRFESALSQFEHRDAIEIVWRSFELDASAPPRQDRPAVELLAAKYRMPQPQAQYMMDNMTATGATEGIMFRFDRLISGNTFDAHRLIHLAATHQQRDAMVERLFSAYFANGDAIGDHDTLVRLASEIGLDAAEVRATLASDAFTAEVRDDELRGQQFGVTGVPFFAIDERFGISGAQPASAILAALTEAWAEFSLTES